MKNPTSEQVVNHLEFLGYTVEDLNGEEVDIMVCRSDSRADLVLRIFKNNLILISARFNLSDSNSIVTQEFLNAINAANAKTAFSKAHYEEEEDKKIILTIETFAVNYNKQAFPIIMDSFENEIPIYLKNLKEYYSKE